MDRPMNGNQVTKQKELFIKLIDLAKKINKPAESRIRTKNGNRDFFLSTFVCNK